MCTVLHVQWSHGQKWLSCPLTAAIYCCASVNFMCVLFMNPAVSLCPIYQKRQIMYCLWHNFKILNTQPPTPTACAADCPYHCSVTVWLYHLWCILVGKVHSLLSEGQMSIRLPSVDDRMTTGTLKACILKTSWSCVSTGQGGWPHLVNSCVFIFYDISQLLVVHTIVIPTQIFFHFIEFPRSHDITQWRS